MTINPRDAPFRRPQDGPHAIQERQGNIPAQNGAISYSPLEGNANTRTTEPEVVLYLTGQSSSMDPTLE